MNELMEQPLVIIAIGMLTMVILCGGLIKTGHRGLIVAILVALLLFGGLLTAERMIVTDREQLRDELRDIAQSVRQNDLDGILQHIHPKGERISNAARMYVGRFEFTAARVTKFHEFKINANRTPPQATVEFMARVEGRIHGTAGPTEPAVRYLIVEFEKKDKRWLIYDYEDRDFYDGIRRRASR